MTNGGWTVIQRRQDGSENFFRTWNEYATGFGNRTGEYWLGLENIHLLTRNSSSLYIDMRKNCLHFHRMESFGDVPTSAAYAEYTTFKVNDNMDKYRLTVAGYKGNCSDSLSPHNNTPFSTLDNDNDLHGPYNCAEYYRGAWWYKSCFASSLNGLYLDGASSNFGSGIIWNEKADGGDNTSKQSFKRIHKQPEAIDCLALFQQGYLANGVYVVQPVGGTNIEAWCDMTNGGWTVIQRRQDGSEDFYRGWGEYVEGFGNKTGEYWLGLENIHRLTKNSSSLYIEMEAFGDVPTVAAYAEYTTFKVNDNSDKYRLTVAGFNGNCSDDLTYHNNSQFTTFDSDNDAKGSANCAVIYSGAWWYNNCHHANLNGLYLGDGTTAFGQGVNWYSCWGLEYSLKRTVMKILRNV
ncbi:microfibril-associated glycoprotein 4-like [Mercenaria mercenaria]|uniref:microfibril-associated glycoprotein 4-like n=1 Tax=Mercenaria mercenaria TaxID=6596 RepID=UPI00234F343E|nr:microfibril-associated glycoprotein 4-like [Mercenaria mercenaria]